MTFSARRPWRILWVAPLLFACEVKLESLLDLPSAPGDRSMSADVDRAPAERPDRATPEDARISEDQRAEDAAQLADQAPPPCDEESGCDPGFLCDDGDCVPGECLVDEQDVRGAQRRDGKREAGLHAR